MNKKMQEEKTKNMSMCVEEIVKLFVDKGLTMAECEIVLETVKRILLVK